MNPLSRLASIIGLLGLLIAFVPENTTKPFKLSAEELLEEVQYGTEMISPDELAEWLVNQDPSIQLIDVRNPEEYSAFHLSNAINIPFNDLLSDDWIDYLDQDIKMNIFYSNGNTKSNEAWMLTRQLGYENNYVLQGGLNYWAETILNPQAPSTTSPDDEIARYQFRKGAGMVFGSVSESNSSNEDYSPKSKPKIKRRKKKKAPEGGC